MLTKNKSLLFLGCSVLLVLIGYLDWITGYNFSLMPFYLLPLGIAAWYLSLWGTLFFAIAVILVRDWVDSTNPYSQHWFFYWNALMRVGLWLTFAICIRQMSNYVTMLRETIKELYITFEESWLVGGCFPICTVCKTFRADSEYMEHAKKIIERHPNARFIHSICPHCAEVMKSVQESQPTKQAALPRL
jgi:hypothetical protein